MRHGKYPFVISFLAIPVVLYVIYVIGPYAQAFYLALTNYNGFSAPTFVGFENTSRCSTHSAAGAVPASGVAGAPVVAEWWRLLLLLPLVLVACGCGFAVGVSTVPVL
jgi:ABC-type sugar transport system permease subunit